MIKEWRISGFKSICSEQKLPIRPLTVLAGSNSSGKSTVLQSMLLVGQTMTSKVATRPLVLNGDYIKLGGVEDILNERSSRSGFSLAFRLQLSSSARNESRLAGITSSRLSILGIDPNELKPFVDVDLRFAQAQEKKDVKPLSLQVQLISADYEILIEGENGDSPDNTSKILSAFGPTKFAIRRRNIEEAEEIGNTIDQQSSIQRGKVLLDSLTYEVSTGNDAWSSAWRRRRRRQLNESIDIVAVELEHFLPRALVNRYNIVDALFWDKLESLADRPSIAKESLARWADEKADATSKALADAIGEVSQGNLLTVVQALNNQRRGTIKSRQDALFMTDDIVKLAKEKTDPNLLNRRGLELQPVPDSMVLASDIVTQNFLSMRYLGPLRDDPRPVYDIANSADPSHVGSKGEYTAAVLDLYANQLVDFIAPDDTGGNTQQIDLKSAVQRWLTHFAMGQSLTTKEEGKLGHRLLVKSENTEKLLDLTNVGVGVSQVLPIVVMALISEPGSILIFEQPELHLHPRVQSLLGDFFLAVVKTGRQCIVETHSEYLINRLRLRVAESPWDSNLKDEIGLYFSKLTSQGSTFQFITISDYGSIPDWPEGFFDQGPKESDRIIKASLAKRKNSAKRQ